MASYYENQFNYDTSSSEEAAKEARKAYEEEAERAYKSVDLNLKAEERALRADQPLLLEQLKNSIQGQITPLTQGKEEELYGLGTQERDLKQNTTGLVNTASRTYNELATGIPRYAGTSAAGAYGEILGRETARQIGEAKQKETTGIFDIGQAKNRVIRFYQQKVSDIQTAGTTMLKQAQQQFLNAMDKINTLRRVAEEDKKSLRLQALYNYKSSIAEIRANAEANKLAMDKWVYEKNQDLKNRVGAAGEKWDLGKKYQYFNDAIAKGVPYNEASKILSTANENEAIGIIQGFKPSNMPSWAVEATGSQPVNLGGTSSNLPSGAFGNSGINFSLNEQGDVGYGTEDTNNLLNTMYNEYTNLGLKE